MMVDSFPESELILLVLESENETLYANKPEIQIWLDFEDKPLYIHVLHNICLNGEVKKIAPELLSKSKSHHI